MFDQSLNVLDVGCGLGMQAEWWATRRPKLDNDKFGLKASTECHGVDLYPADGGLIDKFFFKQEDYHNMSYSNAQFDIVWSHFSLEYSPSPMKALAEWRRVCKDDGHLYLTVPCSFKKKFGRIHTDTKPGQQSWYTAPILINMLAYTGWLPKDSYFQVDFKKGVIRAIIAANPDQSTPLDPITTNIYELDERGLFDRWCSAMIHDRGMIDESNLVITWVTGTTLDFRSL